MSKTEPKAKALDITSISKLISDAKRSTTANLMLSFCKSSLFGLQKVIPNFILCNFAINESKILNAKDAIFSTTRPNRDESYIQENLNILGQVAVTSRDLLNQKAMFDSKLADLRAEIHDLANQTKTYSQSCEQVEKEQKDLSNLFSKAKGTKAEIQELLSTLKNWEKTDVTDFTNKVEELVKEHQKLKKDLKLLRNSTQNSIPSTEQTSTSTARISQKS